MVLHARSLYNFAISSFIYDNLVQVAILHKRDVVATSISQRMNEKVFLLKRSAVCLY